MTEVLVFAAQSRADATRALLARACAATGVNARLDLHASGSLYQRLGARPARPMGDIVFWFGAFAASAAAADNLLQAYHPTSIPDGGQHAADWKWVALDCSPVGVVGGSPVASWQDLAGVPRLAMADPERSEAGLSVLLSSLDRARQAEGDVERGWTWWQQRAQAGLALVEDEADAQALVQSGAASHALSLAAGGSPLAGVAPIPHAIALTSGARNVDAARQVLDWLTSESAGATLDFSAWQASTNGLAGLLSAAPALDVDWCREQYVATRQRWAASGFGPSLT